jgi:WD40 repeat protein
VFRDQRDFTGVEYYSSLDGHLRNSLKLIVVCSPAALASKYVNDEIRRFAKLRGGSNIIPLLLSGEPTGAGQGSNAAFPEAMCEVLSPMPLAVDYREFREPKQRLNAPPFQDAWFGLLANILDLPRAEIEQRERQRRLRLQRITAAITTAVIGILSVALIVALMSRRDAVRERDVAEQRRKLALARDLMTKSLTLSETRYDNALLLALEATRLAPGLATRTHLRDLLNRNMSFTRLVRTYDKPLQVLLWERATRTLVSVDKQGRIMTGELGGSVREHVLGVSGECSAAALHPTGTPLALAFGQRIELWNTIDGAKLGVLDGHHGEITSLSFSPDGKLLASGSWDNTAIIWDLQQGRPKYPPLRGHRESEDPLSMAKGVLGVAFSSAGAMLATTGGDNTAVVWDVSTGRRLLGPLKGHGTRADQLFPGVRAVAFSPDDKILATGGDDREVRIWEMASGNALGEPLTAHERPISALAFIDNTRIVSADNFRMIRVLSLTEKRPSATLVGHSGGINNLVVVDLHSVLSGGEDGRVLQWDPFPRSDRLASEFFHPLSDAEPRFNRTTRRRHFPDLLVSVAFSSSGRSLASGADDGTVVAWDLTTAKERARFFCQPGQVFAVTFSPDESALACAGLGSDVIIRDLVTGTDTRLPFDAPAGAVDFNLDGRRVAVGYANGRVRVWRTQQQLVDVEFVAGASPVFLARFVEEGRRVLAMTTKGDLVLWDIPLGAVSRRAQLSTGSRRLYATVDGDMLAIASGHEVRLWSISRWRQTSSVPIPREANVSEPAPIAIRKSRLALASGTAGAAISVFDSDIQTGLTPWPTLDAHASISAIAFDAEGRRVAAVGASGYVTMWELDWDSWVRTTCSVAGHSLNTKDWSEYLGDEPYHPTCDASQMMTETPKIGPRTGPPDAAAEAR